MSNPESSGQQPTSDMEPTGRRASFYCPVESEMDVEAVAQRVAQFVAVGWQRGELDGVKIQMMEAQKDDGE